MARQNQAKTQQSKPAPQTAETPKLQAVVPQPNTIVSPAKASPAPRSPPSHEQIAQRAYELYLARGGQHGRHEEDWTQAERELSLGR